MRAKVKVCGLTRISDALLASDLGASAVGFVFWEKSPRYIDPDQAAAIVARLPPDVAPVGVFVDASPGWVKEVADHVGLSAIQLHGDESPDSLAALRRRVIKAVPLRGPADVAAASSLPEAVTPLIDAHDPVKRGGTGRTVDWAMAATLARQRRVFLAGGLTPSNVGGAVRAVRPYGIDVSSGVETSPGVKSPELLHAFFEAVFGMDPASAQTETEG